MQRKWNAHDLFVELGRGSDVRGGIGRRFMSDFTAAPGNARKRNDENAA
jgi:hypothetical protein